MISFKYENNGLNDEQLNELNKFLNDNIKSIMDFFNFDKNIIITIKIFECKDNLDNYVLNHMGNKLKDYTVGLIKPENDTVLCCSYNDYDNTVHQKESFIDYQKMILHECVHILHTYYMIQDSSYFYSYLWEGIACYLTKQYEQCNINNVEIKDIPVHRPHSADSSHVLRHQNQRPEALRPGPQGQGSGAEAPQHHHF